MVEVKAFARRIRMSPKKVRLVANMVRGLTVSAAEAQLTFLNKAAARPVLKLIRSAKANAEHNFKLTGDGLYIKTIMVDGGPTLHRWIPRAHGRATPIRKRTSHITVILADRDSEVSKEIAKAVVKKSRTADSEAVSQSESESSRKNKALSGTSPKKSATPSKATAEKADDKKKEVKKAEKKTPATKQAGKKSAEAKSTKPQAEASVPSDSVGTPSNEKKTEDAKKASGKDKKK